MKKAKIQLTKTSHQLTVPKIMKEVEEAKALLVKIRSIARGRQPRVIAETNRRLKELSAKGIKDFVIGDEYNTLTIVFGDDTKVVFTVNDTAGWLNYSDSLYSTKKDPIFRAMVRDEKRLTREFNKKRKLIPVHLHHKVAGL